MFTRTLLAAVIASALLFPGPGWTVSVVGVLGPNTGTTIGGAGQQPGGNVYSGSVLEVGPGGGSILTFGHNAMVRFGQETAAQLERDSTGVSLELLRGRMVFRSTPGQQVMGRVGDAAIRPERTQDVTASVAFRNPKLVVIMAQRGMLLVATEHDGRSVTVPQGEFVQIALDDTAPAKPPAAGTPQQQQDDNHRGKKWGAWVVLGGAAFITAGMVLAEQNETQFPVTTPCPPQVSASSPTCP